MPRRAALKQPVNIHQAKTELSKLIERVEAGEEIVIARAGRPVAKLVAVKPRARRKLGWLNGQFTIPDDFDRLLVAQSIIEPMILLTLDETLRAYGSTVRVV